MIKHLIFDFDGTLANSLPVAIEIAQELVPGLNLRPEEVEALREMSAREAFRRSGIPYRRVPKLLLNGKRLLSHHLSEVAIFPGLAKVLKRLKAEGYQMSVVSSNSEANIRRVLRKNGVEDCMKGVYGNVGLFSKNRAFRVVMRDQETDAKDCLYVGDEVRDIEAARKAGVTIISVTWGYNGPKILASYKPDFLVQTASELLTTIQQIKG